MLLGRPDVMAVDLKGTSDFVKMGLGVFWVPLSLLMRLLR